MLLKHMFAVITAVLILLQIGYVADILFANMSRDPIFTPNTITDNLKELPQLTRTNIESNLFDVIVLVNEVNTFSTKNVNLRIIANNTSNEVAYASIIQEPSIEIVFDEQVISETIHVSKKNFIVAPHNLFVIAELSINIPGPCVIRVHRGSYVVFINDLKLIIDDMVIETTINYTRSHTLTATESTKSISSKKTSIVISDIVVDDHILGSKYEEHEPSITRKTEPSTTSSTTIQTTIKNTATSTHPLMTGNKSMSTSANLNRDGEYIKIPLEIVYALVLTIAVLVASKLIVHRIVR